MRYFYSEILLLPNENSVQSSVQPIILLLILYRFSNYYKVRINEFSISCSSFKILFGCADVCNAKKFVAALKKNYTYWCNRLLKVGGCKNKKAQVRELINKERFIKCAFEILEYRNLKESQISSYMSHYLQKNSIDLRKYLSAGHLQKIVFDMSKARSRVNSAMNLKYSNLPISRNYLNVSALLNVDTTLIDSTFSFKTFGEIVNLHIK